jgi:hypothetical protein
VLARRGAVHDDAVIMVQDPLLSRSIAEQPWSINQLFSDESLLRMMRLWLEREAPSEMDLDLALNMTSTLLLCSFLSALRSQWQR